LNHFAALFVKVLELTGPRLQQVLQSGDQDGLNLLVLLLNPNVQVRRVRNIKFIDDPLDLNEFSFNLSCLASLDLLEQGVNILSLSGHDVDILLKFDHLRQNFVRKGLNHTIVAPPGLQTLQQEVLSILLALGDEHLKRLIHLGVGDLESLQRLLQAHNEVVQALHLFAVELNLQIDFECLGIELVVLNH
jgi:hypothetical protein